jgi:hypothetical protein
LYRIIREGWTPEKAFEPMRSVWEADDVWGSFIVQMLAQHAAPSS